MLSVNLTRATARRSDLRPTPERWTWASRRSGRTVSATLVLACSLGRMVQAVANHSGNRASSADFADVTAGRTELGNKITVQCYCSWEDLRNRPDNCQ